MVGISLVISYLLICIVVDVFTGPTLSQGLCPYVVHRSINDPSNLFVYEKYESMDALKTHPSTPHIEEFSRAVASMVDGRPEVGRYREIV